MSQQRHALITNKAYARSGCGLHLQWIDADSPEDAKRKSVEMLRADGSACLDHDSASYLACAFVVSGTTDSIDLDELRCEFIEKVERDRKARIEEAEFAEYERLEKKYGGRR